MASDLPAELKNALERITFGVSRNDAALRARRISETYRGGGTSAGIADRDDALAYALARMPATYAAVSACLDAVARARPAFLPASLLDLGAGPGTATWAAADTFAALTHFASIDINPALRDLARDLAARSGRLASIDYRLGDARSELAVAAPADLVIASYVIAEVTEVEKLVERLWAKTTGILLIVEPGTPDGYARMLGARTQLIALGGQVVAPCPHEARCPLIPPDWCHFAQRLARTRDHKQVKQVDVPFEDEKFSYVAVARTPAEPRMARVLAPPAVGKAATTLKLCRPDGTAARIIVPRRDKAAYALARRLRWGDTAPDFPEGR
jgi:ribosomal protein RSM22 (predicted rRNA methylase)